MSFKAKIAILIVLLIILVANTIMATKKGAITDTPSLHYLIKYPIDTTQKFPLLILLHGHGSNEHDLFNLSDQIPENWMVVSVRAPYTLANNSFRWYDVKMINNKIKLNLAEEEKSRKELLALIADLTKRYNIDHKKIVAAGFSQGANMAQALGLSEPQIVSGFGVFSGRFIEEFEPYIQRSTALKPYKAFISHGSNDRMLPTTYSIENIQKLKALGIEITYCEDTNDHSISSKQWLQFSHWLIDFEKNH